MFTFPLEKALLLNKEQVEVLKKNVFKVGFILRCFKFLVKKLNFEEKSLLKKTLYLSKINVHSSSSSEDEMSCRGMRELSK